MNGSEGIAVRATDDLRRIVAPYVGQAVFFSLCYNLLLLISPLYMLQVYDRVLTSGSIETLILLTALAVAMYIIYATADAGRKRVFALMGVRLSDGLEGPIFARGMTPMGAGPRFEAAVQDLGRVQAFFGGGPVQILFDMPFAPVFCILVFLVHPLLGWITVIGAVVLALIALWTERATKGPLDAAASRERAASTFLGGISRSYGVVTSMGMGAHMLTRWRALRAQAQAASLASGGTAGLLGGASRGFRQMLQTLILGLAAWLVLRGEISSGAIIASSILSGRALGPIDQAIAAWKPALRARRSWQDLRAYVDGVALPSEETPLPMPVPLLRLDGMAVQVPGSAAPLIAPMSFALQPGEILLVLGASGQGKSALLQTLATAWPPAAGGASLGGRDLHAWASVDRGPHLGYLPQGIDLLPGTVRHNIERFGEGPAEAVVAAAQSVGAHETILALPDGYDTVMGPAGQVSAGQRQLIGLARANYDAPALLLLDEPTASLDQRASASLLALLQACKRDGRVAVVATHDHRLLPAADKILMIERPQPRMLTRDEFLRALHAPRNRVHPVAAEA